MGLNELELPELKHIPKVKFDSGTYENLLSTINLMSYEEVKNLGFKGQNLMQEAGLYQKSQKLPKKELRPKSR